MKETTCVSCGQKISIDESTAYGQHVLCPYCNRKFSYLVDGAEFSTERLSYAIAECRKNAADNRYYSAAPAGARLYIGLVFYGKVFKDGMNLEHYMAALSEIETQLKASDWEYLLAQEKDSELSTYFLDKLNEAQGTNLTMSQVAKPHRGIPEEGILRTPVSTPPIAQNPIVTRRLQEAEQYRENVSRKVERVEREKLYGKIVIMVGSLAAAIVGLVLFLALSSPKPNPPAGNESLPPVRVAEPTPQETLAILVTNRLAELHVRKEAVQKSMAEIRENQRMFEAELGRAVERGNLKAAEMQAKGAVRLGGAEMAMAVLKSSFFNELSARYQDAKPFAKADECRHLVRSAETRELKMLDQLAVSYLENAAGELRRSMEDRYSEMKSLLADISRAIRQLKALQMRAYSADKVERATVRGELDTITRSAAFMSPCQLELLVAMVGNSAQDADEFSDLVRLTNAERNRDFTKIDTNTPPMSTSTARVKEKDHVDSVVRSIDPAPIVKPDKEQEQHEPVKSTKPRGRRQKCKSTIKCSNFAEPGHNFCADHECHSYGCKEHVRILSSPNWAHGGMQALSSQNTAERKLIKRKCIGQYCKKHCCTRICPEIKNYNEWWNGYLYWDNPQTEKFFYCDNERLANSRYCIEHACKVPTCNSCREEYWKLDDGSTHQETVSEINLEYWWRRWNRKWLLIIGPMCRAHSNMDPEAVKPRDTRTFGDILQRRESK